MDCKLTRQEMTKVQEALALAVLEIDTSDDGILLGPAGQTLNKLRYARDLVTRCLVAGTGKPPGGSPNWLSTKRSARQRTPKSGIDRSKG